MASKGSRTATDGRPSGRSPAARSNGAGAIVWTGSLSSSSVSRWLHPSSGDSCRALIVGAPGAGKTLLVRALAQMMRVPTLVVDPTWTGRLDGWYRASSAADAIDLVRAGHVAVFSDVFGDAYDLAWGAGDCLLVVDEAAVTGGARGAVHPALLDLMRRGRHRRVSVLLATQRRTDVDPTLQGLADAAWIGLLPGQADRQWAVGTWGIEPPDQPLEFRVWLPGGVRGGAQIKI